MRLAAISTPQSLDRFVAHRRPAVGVEELTRMTWAVVVLQRPHPRRQVVLRIAQPGTSKVDEAAEPAIFDEHVGQAVVAVDQHMALPWNAERAARGVDRMDATKDLPQLACDRRSV